MPRKSFEVNVEPKVLIWARESMGMSLEEVSRKFRVSENTISEWESGQKKPTLIQLEKLARSIYKRPLAVFLLNTPPEEPSLPTDFRTLPADKKLHFSPKTRLAIRKARRLQSLATNLLETPIRSTIFKIGTVSLTDDPELISTIIRKELNVGTKIQFDWENENKALNEWRKAIEKCGVLVLQMSIPLEEARGFSLIDDKLPTIVLNLRDSVNGRIFSLFHEYAHLLLNQSGICNMEEQDYLTGKERLVEKFCNHFAGAILVPKDTLLNHVLIKSKFYLIHNRSDEILKELANSFKVSQEVILRRLVILNLASKDLYKTKREEWESRDKEGEKEKSEYLFRPSPARKCIREIGVPLVSLVIDAHEKGKITYTDVADYLGVRIKHIPKIEQFIGKKV